MVQPVPSQSVPAEDARPIQSPSWTSIHSATGAFDSSATAFKFLSQKEESKVYSVLPLTAQDFVSAPSLQAFDERLFSVCGMLTPSKRNRMDKLLKMHSCMLKLSDDRLSDTDKWLVIKLTKILWWINSWLHFVFFAL